MNRPGALGKLLYPEENGGGESASKTKVYKGQHLRYDLPLIIPKKMNDGARPLA